MAVAPIALGLMAAGTAATAASSLAQSGAVKGRIRGIEGISQRAQLEAEKNRLKADSRWRQTMAKLTPEQQEAATEKAAAERLRLYESVTGTPEQQAAQGNIIAETATSSQPALVRQEALRQLSDKIGTARAQMAARAKLGGWEEATRQAAQNLRRSGEDIGRLADFTRGRARAAQLAISRTAGKTLPGQTLRGIVKGAGQLAQQAGGSMVGGGGGVGSLLEGMLPAAGESWWTTPFGQWTPGAGNALAWGGTGEKV